MKNWIYNLFTPPAPDPLAIYIMKRIALDHWSMQIFFYLYDKALILKRSLILSNTNTDIWSQKMVWILM